MLWASLVAVRVDPDLRRGRDLAWFAGAGLVAAVTARSPPSCGTAATRSIRSPARGSGAAG